MKHQLTDQEAKYLRVFIGTKSGYRKSEFSREGFSEGDQLQLTEALIGKNLLKKNKAGSGPVMWRFLNETTQ